MRISDWSSDVCSSDLICSGERCFCSCGSNCGVIPGGGRIFSLSSGVIESTPLPIASEKVCSAGIRSEEHTSELQSLMRISYAVFCLKKKNQQNPNKNMR